MASEWRVECFIVGEVLPHPNADSLSITKVHGGYPVVFRTGDFKTGDVAVYVPVDSVMPDTPEWEFLGKKRLVKAKKIRGIFSMGMLMKWPLDWAFITGEDFSERLGITRKADTWETQAESNEPSVPEVLPRYTDIEGYRRWSRTLSLGEEVIITEKIHGENARYGWVNDEFIVASRTKRKLGTLDKWHQVAEAYNLAEKLKPYPGVVLYGESHGYTGGFPYGDPTRRPQFRAFDVFDVSAGSFLDYNEFEKLMGKLGIDVAPVLYRGPWEESLLPLAEGPSTLDPSHVREGIVIRPVTERWAKGPGRVILKLHGEGFLLNK